MKEDNGDINVPLKHKPLKEFLILSNWYCFYIEYDIKDSA